MKKGWIFALIFSFMMANCTFSIHHPNQLTNFPYAKTRTLGAFAQAEGKQIVETVQTLPPANDPVVEETMTPAAKASEKAPAGFTQTPGEENREIDQNPGRDGSKRLSDVKGTLVLERNDNSRKNWILFKVATGEKKQLPDQGKPYIFNAVVSQNGEWLAYVASSDPYRDDLLVIVSSNGEVVKVYPVASSEARWPVQGHEGLIGWVDNYHLLIGYGNRPGAKARSLVLNPFTEEWQIFSLDVPGLFTTVKTSPFWGRYAVTLSVFHPSFDLLVYPSYDGLVLWNRTANRAVSILPDDTILAINEPVWSPDGSSFVTDLFSSRKDSEGFKNRNIFQVFPNGEQIPLTSYSDRTIGDFSDFTWSPDGRSIAFWLKDRSGDGYPQYQLAVLELSSHQVQRINVRPELGIYDLPRSAPVWSPCSQYLAAAGYTDQQRRALQTVIVQLADQAIESIGADGYPVGWMK